MRLFCSFRVLRLIQPSQLKRALLLVFSALLLFSGMLFFVSPVSGAQKHGCAPDPPPPVSGTPSTAPPPPGGVLINEALSQPHSTWNCSEPDGVFSQSQDSWIELYNTQNQAFDLYAAHAEISLDGGTTWYHPPFGTAIGAGSFLVLFPEKQMLAANPVWRVILAAGNAVIDQVTVPALAPDQSYARVPDGSGNWQPVGQPTIDASNNDSNQPITPTPKPAKTPKPTKTPGRGSGGTGSGTEGGGGANVPASAGTQPAWGGVQFPSGSPAPASDASSSSPPDQQQTLAPPTQSGDQHGWLIAMAVTCSLLLLGSLLWCWRLFRAP